MAGFAVPATRGLSVEVLAILAICSTPSPVGDMSLPRVTGDWAQRRGAAGAATGAGGGAAGSATEPVTQRPGVERPGVGRPGVERPGVGRPGVERPGVERPEAERRGGVGLRGAEALV